MMSAVAFALLPASCFRAAPGLLNKRPSGELNHKLDLSFNTLHPGPIKVKGAASIAGLACVDPGGAAVSGKSSVATGTAAIAGLACVDLEGAALSGKSSVATGTAAIAGLACVDLGGAALSGKSSVAT